MASSDDLYPPRRALFLPVVIATVFLTIIGISAGMVLGTRHRAGEKAAQQQQQQGPGAPASGAPAPGPADDRPACRSETQSMSTQYGAVGTLRQELKIRTKTSVVYICEDDNGQLYYHANSGGDESAWTEGQTALFLPYVRGENGTYSVTASDNAVFRVNAERLVITHTDGRVETQNAIG